MQSVERPQRDLRFGVGHESNHRRTDGLEGRKANLKSTAAAAAADVASSFRLSAVKVGRKEGLPLAGPEGDRGGKKKAAHHEANLVNRSRHLQLKAALPTDLPRRGLRPIRRSVVHRGGRNAT